MPGALGKVVTSKMCVRVSGGAVLLGAVALVCVLVSSSHQKSLNLNNENGSKALSAIENAPFDKSACYPEPNSEVPQFIVGYGSLMQTASKSKTYPNTSDNIPVTVEGFSRHWNIKGSSVGFSTTFLGVLKDSSSSFNGVIFQLPYANKSNLLDSISSYDKRERFYCRHSVPAKHIVMLNQSSDNNNNNPVSSGQYWVYLNRPENTEKPSEDYPIVQSYVDIFLTGCLELEEKYLLQDLQFASKCIESTEGWNSPWVNDRLLPRRPYVFEPKAGKVDRLLFATIPKEFGTIKIEG